MTKSSTILFCFLIIPALLACPVEFQTNTSFLGPRHALAGELTPMHPGYPEVFDTGGLVNYVHDDALVIHDASFALSSSTTYHTPQGSVSKSAIPQGSEVGILLTKDGTIMSVWLLKKNGAKKQNTTEPKGRIPYKTEDGVWRN